MQPLKQNQRDCWKRTNGRRSGTPGTVRKAYPLFLSLDDSNLRTALLPSTLTNIRRSPLERARFRGKARMLAVGDTVVCRNRMLDVSYPDLASLPALPSWQVTRFERRGIGWRCRCSWQNTGRIIMMGRMCNRGDTCHANNNPTAANALRCPDSKAT